MYVLIYDFDIIFDLKSIVFWGGLGRSGCIFLVNFRFVMFFD